MFKFIALLALLAAVVLVQSKKNDIPVPRSSVFNDLVVNTEGGQVLGTEERVGLLGDRYFSWKGIPYAQPPTGNLRFRAPVPHAGWTGVWDASEHGENCPSSGWLSEKDGDEDCLFLNVYTTSIIDRRPVMVWIHGGSFTGGSGDDSTYGPDHFVTEDVVVVTINYRVGVLGFMSTGDNNAPGNQGLKDMQLALRWVRNNILNFGGDPDNITIFGESAGGCAVHYLMLSPLSAGLFHKVISQSGTVLSPWAFNHDPLSAAQDLAAELGLTYSSNADLVNQLRNVPARDLVIATPGWLDAPVPRGLAPFPFTPVIDAPDSSEPRVIPQHPRLIMESGNFMDVPFMAGFTSDESLFMIREQLLDPSTRDVLNANRHMVVPETLWGVDPHSAAGTTIANEFHQLYLNNQPLVDDNRYEWTTYNTDHHFGYGVDTTLRAHLAAQSSPIYSYVFSFDGDLNLVKRALLLTSYPGAMHADEIPYMFSVSRVPAVILPGNHANVVRRRLTRMWSDFARTGNPTPTVDALITATWPRMTSNLEFMDIGHDLVPGTNPLGVRLNLWQDLRQRFGK